MIKRAKVVGALYRNYKRMGGMYKYFINRNGEEVGMILPCCFVYLICVEIC